MLLQYAIPSAPVIPGISNHLEALAQDFNRLENEILSSATKYFEVKGDLIKFKNTEDLAKNIHAVTVKLNDAAQTAIKTLNTFADKVRSMDDRTLCAYFLARFIEVRPNDASMMQLLGLLAAGEAAVGSGEVVRLAESLLRKLAALIEQKTRPLAKAAKNPRALSWKVWAALENNAFNWKTQQFQASGALAKLVNWYKLNPMASKAKADLESFVLGRFVAAALGRVGLTASAIQPTANALVAVAMGDGKA